MEQGHEALPLPGLGHGRRRGLRLFVDFREAVELRGDAGVRVCVHEV